MSETGAIPLVEVTQLGMAEKNHFYRIHPKPVTGRTALSTSSIAEFARTIAAAMETMALVLVREPSAVTSSSFEGAEESPTASDASPSLAKPCDALFEDLARSNPEQLVRLIRSGALAGADLASAAEIAGAISESALVVPALMPLLSESVPMIREGAIYGLANHLTAPVRRELERLSSDEGEIAEIRAIAAGVLDD